MQFSKFFFQCVHMCICPYRGVTWDAQGYRGYVGHGESSFSLKHTIHNSTPMVGAGVLGPGLGSEFGVWGAQGGGVDNWFQ